MLLDRYSSGSRQLTCPTQLRGPSLKGMKVMPRLLLLAAATMSPGVALSLLLYTYVSMGTASQRSGLNSSGLSQLWMVFWIANSGVPTMVPAGMV
jgi:hypothetical protein